jgi:peptidoglycan/LPS O-acetylase OafA/YrhL
MSPATLAPASIGTAARPASGPASGPPSGQGRVAALDGLRGLLAVVVLAWHVCAPFGVGWMLPLANVAVGLFFLMSGYVLTRGWDGRFGLFLARRFLRLWPVYALCLGAGYWIAGVQPVWSEFLWYPYIGPNGSPAIDPPVWSLCLEAYAMPLMPLIVWAGAASGLRAAFCMAAAAAVGLAIPQVSVLALFIAGAFLARVEWRNRVLESALPQWLGKVSYSLYLSHFLVLELAMRAFGPWGGVAAVPAAFAVGWLVWLAVERPSIGLSRALARAVRPPARLKTQQAA